MTDSPKENLSFELWHVTAREQRNLPWGMSLAVFILGYSSALGHLLNIFVIQPLLGFADFSQLSELLPSIIIAAMMGTVARKVYITVGKPVKEHFTELRGDAAALEYRRGDDWVSVPWDCVIPPRPVAPILLNEKTQPTDRADFTPRFHGRNLVIYEIGFRGPESNRPSIYFTSVPYFNNKTRAYISQAEASGADQPVEAV